MRLTRQAAWRIVAVVLACALPGHSQAPPDPALKDSGFSFYEDLSGSAGSLGAIMRLDSTLGYDFNSWFGMDVGFPVYFVRPSSSLPQSPVRPSNGFGDAYVDLRLTFARPAINYFTMLTGTAPTGKTTTGFSTGRVTFSWDNYFNRDFGRFRPFADAAFGNSSVDVQYWTQPYRTLGLLAHFEGGGSYRLFHRARLAASAYDDVPIGPQRIFSLLVPRTILSGPPCPVAEPFQCQAEIQGPAAIARDYGFAVWMQSELSKGIDMRAGYHRSARWDLNYFSFGVGFELGSLVHRVQAVAGRGRLGPTNSESVPHSLR